MAKIKSALEIALERSESIEADPEKYRLDGLIKQGKRIVGTYLFDPEPSLERFAREYRELTQPLSPTHQRAVANEVVDTLLANIAMPSDDLFVQQLGRVKAALESLIPAEKSESMEALRDMFIQIDGFFQQYLETRTQLAERVRQQYEPQLRRREEQLSRQYGQQVQLRPEQDPEFLKLLDKNLQHLDSQYQEALRQVKEELKGFIVAG